MSEDNNNNNNNNNKPDKPFFLTETNIMSSTYKTDTAREHYQKIRDDIYEEIITKAEGKREKVAGILLELLMTHAMRVLKTEVDEFNETGIVDPNLLAFYHSYISSLYKTLRTIMSQGDRAAEFYVFVKAESNLQWKVKENKETEIN